MTDLELTKRRDPQPEVRLELTDGEGRQIWALYSERPAATAQRAPLGRHLEELLAIAWRRRRTILLGVGIGAILGIVYLLFSPKIYVVRALLQIEQRDSVVQHYDSVRSGSSFLGTQAEVFHSPSIVTAAFDSLGLPPRNPGLLKRATRFVQSLLPSSNGGGSTADPHAAAVIATLAALDATPVLGTEVMAVSYRTSDPQRGARFLQELIARYREYVRDLETAAHREGLDLLREQDQELTTQRSALEDRYEELHSATLALGQDSDALSIQKMRLEEQARAVVRAQGQRIELENRLALQRQNGGAFPEQDGQMVDELQQAQAAMAELRANVSERHPDVRRLQQRIELLREQVAKNSAAHVADLEQELAAARRTEQMLSRVYQQEWTAAKELEERQQKEEQVREEIQRIDEKRDAVLKLLRDKELQVLSLQSGHSGTLVRVLEPPSVPSDSVWPIPGVVLFIFAILGALGGLGAVFWAERRSLRPQTDAEPVWVR